ncbi:MAG: CDP-alcohol phosphatidyltransferase family protein [Patescibacteria group bacterium]|jgi:CDP-diacylglycerol--glycerol-3-phosphate 3-phosphatidyltransferase
MNTKERLVIKLAKIIPEKISPNLLTSVRALLIIPIYFIYRQGAYPWVILFLIVAILTDLLDGPYARFYQRVTNLGKLLDPAADKILFLGMLLMLAPGRLSHEVIVTIVALETFLIFLAIVLGPLMAKLFKIRRKLGANNAGKIKMALESLSLLILLINLNSKFTIDLSEIVMWLAVFFAALSIILHFVQKEENPGNNKTDQTAQNQTAG